MQIKARGLQIEVEDNHLQVYKAYKIRQKYKMLEILTKIQQKDPLCYVLMDRSEECIVNEWVFKNRINKLTFKKCFKNITFKRKINKFKKKIYKVLGYKKRKKKKEN